MKKRKKKEFRRHFRIYLKNNYPAYIVDEEGNIYYFQRVTHSKTSGGRKNWKTLPGDASGAESTTATAYGIDNGWLATTLTFP